MFKRPKWLSPTVLAIGLVSLLTDLSGEMVMPLLPAFITTVLGGGAMAVGLVDGLAELVNSLLQVFAGRRADKTGKRKPLVLAGYSLSGLIRPMMALATAPWHAVAVRTLDRVGKGLRSSPRDSILAQEAKAGQHGRVYSFHRAMDHSGAVLGPLVALGLLALFDNDLRKVFLFAALPGLVVIAVIVWMVHEKKAPAPPQKLEPFSWKPPVELWRVYVPVSVFTLGASSDLFLLLKAGESRTALTTLPLLWMGLHLVKVVSSLLGGQVADRLGELTSISLGWIVYVLVYLGLAYADSPGQVAVLFLVYGTFHGLTEGPEKALVARLASKHARGTAFGWYNLLSGGLMLPASLFFAWLWQAYSPKVAFLSGSGFALVALALLLILRPGVRK